MVLFCAPGPVYAEGMESYSNFIYQGQMSMHVIKISCVGEVTLSIPYGANFDLYAMKGTGSWTPSEDYVMTHYDKAAVMYGQTEHLSLDSGIWYIVVYAQSGFGQYHLSVSSSCPDPCRGDPCCGNPNCGNWGCTPYKTDIKSGYLNAGEWKTYGYVIGGSRSYIEWILKGPCGDEIPVAMMSAGQVSSMRTSYCGSGFNIYAYKDCDPRQSACYAQYADTQEGSNSYVGIRNPTTGSTYYVTVQAKRGSGQYSLYCRSYNCEDDIVVMMNNPDTQSMMSTASNIEGPGYAEGGTFEIPASASDSVSSS